MPDDRVRRQLLVLNFMSDTISMGPPTTQHPPWAIKNPLGTRIPKERPSPAANRSQPAESKETNKVKRRIKLLLADDHPVVRKGIASCLARHQHLEITGEASDGLETIRKAKQLSPDIILMDIDMP